jgi:hypothetical protein
MAMSRVLVLAVLLSIAGVALGKITKKELEKQIKIDEKVIKALLQEIKDWGGGGATVAGDPIMTGFDGQTFEFTGEVGGYYNLISEREHQVSMKLKLGEMWDHNGTYMEGVGYKYREHLVVVELGWDDELEVYLDGKRLHMANGETEQEHILALESGELMLLWQLHRPDMGNAVEITSDLLSITVYLTPAGTRDEGGKLQPAYLNFDAQLLGPPAPGMKGIIGEGYERLVENAGQPATVTTAAFTGREEEYRMADYEDTKHIYNSFGVFNAINPKRRLMERSALAFPLKFGRHAALSAPLQPAALLAEPEVQLSSRKLLLW